MIACFFFFSFQGVKGRQEGREGVGMWQRVTAHLADASLSCPETQLEKHLFRWGEVSKNPKHLYPEPLSLSSQWDNSPVINSSKAWDTWRRKPLNCKTAKPMCKQVAESAGEEMSGWSPHARETGWKADSVLLLGPILPMSLFLLFSIREDKNH